MLTPKKPWLFISAKDDAPRLTLTINAGGSAESDETELTVIPEISAPRPAVMTLTPLANRRMAARNMSGETT